MGKEPNKESSMLWDIQYVKQNKREGTPDYLYLIWRDLNTQEKYLKCIQEPEIDIYFEKEELRNHRYNKNYERIENLNKKTVKYKDIIYEIANEIGERGRQFLNNAFQTRNYQKLSELMLYPYAFGVDYDAPSWYRIKWLREMDNDIPKKLHKGYLDIEVDGIEVDGMPSAQDCPVNAITLIDDWNMTSYTFLLVNREYHEKDTTHMSNKQIKNEWKRRCMYEHMHEEQRKLMENDMVLKNQLHDLFDEFYGYIDYKIYYYEDERKMLVHFFQLINKLKLDFIGIWNISFDIPYLIERCEALGLDPTHVMCHPDFPVKQCYFKADKRNHDIKNKSDTFILSSYTRFICQMELYAAVRKGGQELRSYRLNDIATIELGDKKVDYSDNANIKTLPYVDFIKFIIYNIKDVLLQKGIENRTGDFDTLYISGYKNATDYSKVFKQTVVLRNVQYFSFLNQGLIPGTNINIFNKEEEKKIENEDDEEEDDSYEGALVADPLYNGYVGLELYGKRTNNIFNNGVDFDMSAFYPSSIFAMNIDPSTLIFKTIMDINQYDIFGGDIPFKGITKDEFNRGDDAAKECIDNFQTGNYMTTGTKWFNMPNINEVYNIMKARLK